MTRLPLLLMAGVFLVCGTGYANTQDGKKPAVESACDYLKLATPGLSFVANDDWIRAQRGM